MQLISLSSLFQDEMTQALYVAGDSMWSDKSYHQCLQGAQMIE